MTDTEIAAPPALPGWVRAADAAAVVTLTVAVFVLLFGGFVLHFGPVLLRVHGAERVLFVALALIAIRHAAHPAAPLHRRLIQGLRAGGEGSAVSIARGSLAVRVAVLVVGYFAVVTIGIDRGMVGFAVSPDAALNLPSRFDAGWYGGIALDGYSFEGRFDKQQNVAFFPALPMLMRALGYPMGAFTPGLPPERRMARVLWVGTLISIMAFVWAAIYLSRLARDTIGPDRASSAVALLGAYPFAVFFSAPYTESLFLLGAVAAIYHFRRGDLVRAAAWGLLVGLTRPNGCFLSVVLALMIFERLRVSEIPKSPNHQITKFLAAASAPGVGPFDTLNALGLIFALLMLWPVWRRLGFAYAAFVLVNIGPPLLAGGVLSMGRLTATLFPLFLALAASLSPRAFAPLVTAFAIGQGLVAALFFTWRPLY